MLESLHIEFRARVSLKIVLKRAIEFSRRDAAVTRHVFMPHELDHDVRLVAQIRFNGVPAVLYVRELGLLCLAEQVVLEEVCGCKVGSPVIQRLEDHVGLG